MDQTYYTGIGVASKSGNTESYQQTAKKNALSDMISEIRVKVSSQSALSQFQENQEFRQKFEAETKLTALNTIENFQLVDSWEDKEFYWVYYRLSKAEYEALRQKKMQIAMDQSEALLERAEQLDLKNAYSEALKLKLKALIPVQPYLGEELISVANGHTFNLINRITTSIQEQLNYAHLKPVKNEIRLLVSLKESDAIEASLNLKSGEPIAQIPFRLIGNRGKLPILASTADDGKLFINLNSAGQTWALQSIKVEADILSLLNGDSLNIAVKQIISSLIPPSTTIRIQQEPLLIYIDSKEKSFGNPSSTHTLEDAFKKRFADNNILVIDNPEKASVVVRINADTKSLGPIYKTMYGARLDANFSVVDNRTGSQIYNNNLFDIRGYQNTQEFAGMQAYKAAAEFISRQYIPEIINKITP